MTIFPAVTLCNLNPFSKDKKSLKKHPIWGSFVGLENKPKKYSNYNCNINFNYYYNNNLLFNYFKIKEYEIIYN